MIILKPKNNVYAHTQNVNSKEMQNLILGYIDEVYQVGTYTEASDEPYIREDSWIR
jgi:ribosomal protein S17E